MIAVLLTFGHKYLYLSESNGFNNKILTFESSDFNTLYFQLFWLWKATIHLVNYFLQVANISALMQNKSEMKIFVKALIPWFIFQAK